MTHDYVQSFEIDMEEEFLNLGLDIIGLGVFNYDFGSITRESPVIKVALFPPNPLRARQAWQSLAVCRSMPNRHSCVVCPTSCICM